MSVDFLIILMSMLHFYLMISINIVKRDLSSFHCVENLMLSTPWFMAQGKIIPCVFCGVFL